MVPAEKILQTARDEKADMIGLSGLITPSLDEMVHVAKEMQRQDFKLPLLIGGATTSRAHTAVKIDPEYEEPVVHVKDASRAVGVAQNLISKNLKPEFSQKLQEEYELVRKRHGDKQSKTNWLTIGAARENAFNPVKDGYSPVLPKQPGITILNDYPLEEIVDTIDWTPFFITWELAGKYPRILEDEVVGEEASRLFKDAQDMLAKIVKEKWFEARAIFGLFPANAVGDDIEIYADENRAHTIMCLHSLRQQTQKPPGQYNYALADFLLPKQQGITDYMGAFAVAAGFGMEERLAEFEKDHDDYSAIMLKALADRFAEALAERLHQRIRKEFWGYANDENLDNDSLIAEQYQGIRPAPGYPACPDHTEKALLWELLDVHKHTGIELTESFAMHPGAAVSGWYFAHPESRYFGLGKINQDQVEDYAKRKGETLDFMERWLSPNLGYNP